MTSYRRCIHAAQPNCAKRYRLDRPQCSHHNCSDRGCHRDPDREPAAKVKRLSIAPILALVLLSTGVAAASAQPMVTIMLGRAIDGQYSDGKCKVATSSVPLTTTASYLQTFGLRATAPATLNQIGDTTPVCS